MKRSRHIILIVLVGLFSTTVKAASPEKGFRALAIFDYFRARKIFTDLSKGKYKAAAYYGLSIIHGRGDNPFHNTDSAAAMINRSYAAFRTLRKVEAYSGFLVDSSSILKWADSISRKNFSRAKSAATVRAYEEFLMMNYLGSRELLSKAVKARDQLEFNLLSRLNKSDTTKHFMTCHPQSAFYHEAGLLYQRQLFDEQTSKRTTGSYISFIRRNRGNIMVNTAYENLYAIYKKNSDVKGLTHFVTAFPDAPQHLDAWKLLFSLSVKAYTYSELKKFIDEHPAFPLKNSILKELELNKLILYPYQNGDYSGFIDARGKPVIPAVYDQVSEFSEGLAIVHKNDSVFFINKENRNPFSRTFSDGYNFNNGIAPVKINKSWVFLNRLGQVISREYEEISEISDNAYIVKLNGKSGAVDHFGQTLLEPEFERLGDFRNGYAYYTDKGKYGFVSRAGKASGALYDWISDFDEELVAVIRLGDKFGLIRSSEKRLLEPMYDAVLKTSPGVYLVTLNLQYGFFGQEGCFHFFPNYDYNKEKAATYYNEMKWFRMIRKNDRALADVNGAQLIPFGMYEEFGFPHQGRIMVRKKGKCGFLDIKGNAVIPLKYSDAGDFADSAAIVKLNGRNLLIDTSGRTLYDSSEPIVKVSSHYYFISGEAIVLDHNGKPAFETVKDVRRINGAALLIELHSGENKLISD